MNETERLLDSLENSFEQEEKKEDEAIHKTSLWFTAQSQNKHECSYCVQKAVCNLKLRKTSWDELFFFLFPNPLINYPNAHENKICAKGCKNSENRMEERKGSFSWLKHNLLSCAKRFVWITIACRNSIFGMAPFKPTLHVFFF